MTTTTVFRISLPDCKSNNSFSINNYATQVDAHTAAIDTSPGGLCANVKAFTWAASTGSLYTCVANGNTYSYGGLTSPGDITINQIVTTMTNPMNIHNTVTTVETDACGYLIT